MWNFKAGSKITQERIKQRSYDIHRQKLKSMKSLMKVKKPIQPDFVYEKWKLKLSRRQRLEEIDKHNQILLKKINAVRQAEYTVNKLRPQAQNLYTLNQLVMNDRNDQITKQNTRICKKLLKTESYYPTVSIINKTNQLQQIRYNISQNAKRATSAKPYLSNKYCRPKSSYTSTTTIRRKLSAKNFGDTELQLNRQQNNEKCRAFTSSSGRLRCNIKNEEQKLYEDHNDLHEDSKLNF